MMVAMVIIIDVIDDSNDDNSDACFRSFCSIGCQRSDQRHLCTQRAADLFRRNRSHTGCNHELIEQVEIYRSSSCYYYYFYYYNNYYYYYYYYYRIGEFNEWGLNTILGLVSRYTASSDEEVFAIMNLLDPVLRTANSGAVLATFKCFITLTNSMPELHPQIYARAKPPILTLVSTRDV